MVCLRAFLGKLCNGTVFFPPLNGTTASPPLPPPPHPASRPPTLPALLWAFPCPPPPPSPLARAAGALHGGDSDSTGAIGAAWFGALYGYGSVLETHLEGLEFAGELKAVADKLYETHYVPMQALTVESLSRPTT